MGRSVWQSVKKSQVEGAGPSSLCPNWLQPSIHRRACFCFFLPHCCSRFFSHSVVCLFSPTLLFAPHLFLSNLLCCNTTVFEVRHNWLLFIFWLFGQCVDVWIILCVCVFCVFLFWLFGQCSVDPIMYCLFQTLTCLSVRGSLCMEGWVIMWTSVYRGVDCGLVMPASPALAALFPQISRRTL